MRFYTSKGVESKLTEEQEQEFIGYFLREVPENEIEFVPESFLFDKAYANEKKPIYSVRNKEGFVILVFPMKDEEGNFLYLSTEKECPWLDGLNEYGISYEDEEK
jgi:hypothetical protein